VIGAGKDERYYTLTYSVLDMVTTSKLPHKGKRHQLVGFIASCVPNVKVDTDGAIGIELKVVNYLAEKLQKKIANKKEKEELEKVIKGLEVQSGGKKKGNQRRTGKKGSPKVDDKKESSKVGGDKKGASNLNGEEKEGPKPDSEKKEEKDTKSKLDGEKEDGSKPNSEKKKGKKDAKSDGEKKDENAKSDNKALNDSKLADGEKEAPKSDEEATEKSENETEQDKHSRAANDKQLNASLDETVQEFKPDTTWDMVAGLENAKLQLQLAAELPEKQPALYQGKRKAAQFVLLYGPPGTGKGHLAKALCNSVDSTFFMVSASDMTSKWIGESER
jgi:SpoVK/Ycf46/Vps4 family AAA+-type ATPase